MRDDANRTVNGLHVLHASRTRKKRTATTGLPVGTIGTRKKWGVNIDPHMDPFTAPLRPSYRQVQNLPFTISHFFLFELQRKIDLSFI